MNRKLPLTRSENIVVQETNGEVLIYDLKKNKAICLNQNLAVIWKHCNGKSTFDDVIKDFADNHQLEFDDDYIWLALSKLAEKDLIQTKFAVKPISRREIIFKYGLASVALPAIAVLIAPTAAQAQSCLSAGGFAPGTPVNATIGSGGTETCQKILEEQCCSGVVTNYIWNTSPTSQDGSCDAQCK